MQGSNVCNLCGKELDFWDVQEDFTLHRHVGYGSGYDGEVIKLRLCCECFDHIVDECKVSPIEEVKEVKA